MLHMDLDTGHKEQLKEKPIRWLGFLSKVAFICNLFFGAAVVWHFYSYLQNPEVISTVIILGYLMGFFILNPLVTICYFLLLLRRKNITESVPAWLVIANFIFLVIEVLFTIFLNDK